MARKILLNYSVEKVKEPILSEVIRETGLALNILYAEFGAKGGEILISVEAPDPDVERAVELFRKKGLEVKEIKRAIRLDRESCIDCGACLSLCPSGALYQDKDNTVLLDEDKCVYCELCVPACPVRALELSKF
ncbi:MAG: 4Fe-4S binding protein [Candidatus Hadarchaeum sp.]|uniref:4Fe-4S binding protein n=1 Tax=Candidatus Hadarchaeum sp. TaxID=2883567 RepID=UPI003D0B4586